MSNLLRASVASALLALATPAYAAINLQPGEWQETETGTEDGKPVRAEVNSSCMTPEEAKDPVKQMAVIKDQSAGHCEKLDVRESGNVVTLVMKCGDPKQYSIDIVGTFTFVSATRYTGTMKSTVVLGGKTMTQDKKIDAVRVGECKKK